MLRRSILAGLCLATTLLGAASAMPSSALAFDGYGERSGYERAYGWRPAPPAVHGYWGHRRWRRFHEDNAFRGPPPPPPPWYGWR